ncbi:MAG: hypothetical protein CMI52_02830 [Parcubacteria group bacterium]|nr:hypothetical protein [Parcubacteria group bacterium]
MEQELMNLVVVLVLCWFCLGAIAHMIGGQKWANKIWRWPFKMIGKIIRWTFVQIRALIREALSGLWNALRGRRGNQNSQRDNP